jgi:LPS-assembly protein
LIPYCFLDVNEAISYWKVVNHDMERSSVIPIYLRVIHPIIIIFLLLWALSPCTSFAQQDVLKKNLFISDSPLKLSQWDSLAYDNQSGTLTVTGDNVRAETRDDVIEFRKGEFNVNDKTGEVLHGMLFFKQNNLHIRGELIQRSGSDTYKIEDFRLTTCDTETPSWSITGSEISVVKEGYGKIKNAAFRIRNFPVFYLPYMIFPAKTQRQTGLLLPQLGYSSLNGAGIEIPFFWAISDHTDATFYERYMSNRGLMQGLEFRYITGSGSKGEFLFDNLHDKIKTKDMRELDQAKISPFERTNQDRYWLRGRLNQDLPAGLTARMDLDLVSDQDYLREFEREFVGIEERPDIREDFGRPLEGRFSPFRSSGLRVSSDGADYSLQGSGYYYQKFDTKSGADSYQPLAGVFYSLLPIRLSPLPVYFNAATEFNYTHNDTGVEGHNLSVNPEITYPQQIGDYLKLNSSLNYTGNLETYDAASGNRNSVVKNAYQAKVALSTILDRVFAVDWNRATKLKHQIIPSIDYEYGKFSNLPINQDQDEDPWFDPIAPGSKINRLGMSVENLLDASSKNDKGEVSYRQWAQLDVTQRYDLEELQRRDLSETNKKPWEPLLATLILRPFKDLNLRANAAWDYYKDRISTAVLSLNIVERRSEDRTDRYSIDYLKNVGSDDSLILHAETTFYDGLSVGVLVRRNLTLNYDVTDSFWLQYQAHCWSIKLGTELENANRSLIFKFQLSGF